MAEETKEAHYADLRSYGRRRGRKPSKRQAALLQGSLPRLAIDLSQPPPNVLSRLFAHPVSGVCLEIGFGGGEHLIWQAEQNKNAGFIGCELFEDGVVKALSEIEERGLGNVRLHADDARPLLRWLPPQSVGRAFILFPDPWPKKRHRKRRIVNTGTLDLLARVLKPAAELRLATDIGDYARHMLQSLLAHPAFQWDAKTAADWRERGPDWPQTRYEEKARREGRHPYFLKFQRQFN